MPEKTIKFMHAYRKLRHPCFTTVRRWTEEKERYYRRLVGHTLDVLVEGRPFPEGRAVLSFVTRLDVADLPETFLRYDTDNGRYRLPPKMDSLVLTFVWEDGLVPDNL
jgi:hypothetical protein